MRIVWEDGKVDIMPMGFSICGLHRSGKRPVDVLIGIQELIGYLDTVHDIKEAQNYLVGTVGKTVASYTRTPPCES